jgi:L-asparaginase II
MVNPVLVQVFRGETVESFHRGSVAMVDGDGALVCALGDVERPVFPRSAVKLLQALPLVASGAADRLGLTDDELALACASHNGEERHVHTAAGMLAKAGVDAAVLECDAHWPGLDSAARALAAAGAAPSALHNNCSGKHAGFVCLGCLLAGDDDPMRRLRGYVQPEHPVMREVSAALQAATGCDLQHALRGTDGCSMPAFAIPLRRLALAFARVATGRGLQPGHATAAQRLRAAIAHAPYMVAGSGRFDTRVMERGAARVLQGGRRRRVLRCPARPGPGRRDQDGRRQQRPRGRGGDGGAGRGAAAAGRCRRALHARVQAALKNWNGIEVGRLAAHEGLRALRA